MGPRGVVAGVLVISVLGVEVWGESMAHANFNVPAPRATINQMVSNVANTVVYDSGIEVIPRGYGTGASTAHIIVVKG
ncbi:MAG: hypothetical protein WBZ01_21435 [Terriglobales bacterium]|jgi:hypothetical protein